MAHFLRSHMNVVRGLRLPIKDDSELLDFEYAVDIALYIQDDVESLERVKLEGTIMVGHFNGHTSHMQVPFYDKDDPMYRD